jgi:multidrug efflux pump subunit AcrA (membrane-fusion protein)
MSSFRTAITFSGNEVADLMCVWRRSKNIGISALSAASLVLLTACAKKQSGPPPNVGPVQVSVATVEQRDVSLAGDWVATLDGYVNAQIQPQVSGYLIKQDYREGSVVQSGEVLFELIPGHFRQRSIKRRVS